MELTALWFLGVTALTTLTLDVIDSKTDRMGTIATDESTILVRDHRFPNRSDRAIWASDYEGRVSLSHLHLRIVCRTSDAKSAIMLRVRQLYRLRVGGIEDSAGISAPLPRGRQASVPCPVTLVTVRKLATLRTCDDGNWLGRQRCSPACCAGLH
jgi:hypothetical protein